MELSKYELRALIKYKADQISGALHTTQLLIVLLERMIELAHTLKDMEESEK